MATNPMLDAVLRFHHQQTTSPWMPDVKGGVNPTAAAAEPVEDVGVSIPPESMAMAKPLEEKEVPVEEVEEEDAESDDEEDEEEEEEESDG